MIVFQIINGIYLLNLTERQSIKHLAEFVKSSFFDLFTQMINSACPTHQYRRSVCLNTWVKAC